MNKGEKKALRDHIGKFLDISSTHLKDKEAIILQDFIDSYDEVYKGRSIEETTSFCGWCSDGKYRREETTIFTFMDEPGIKENHSYRDDDGQNGSHSLEIRDGRGILDFLLSHVVS